MRIRSKEAGVLGRSERGGFNSFGSRGGSTPVTA